MVLANASLDIALHDTSTSTTLHTAIASNLFIEGKKLKTPKPLGDKQLAAFTVGLLDGDGSIQVNHWRKRILKFRLIVKLADKPLNYEMLSNIAKVYGGFVRRSIDKKTNSVFVLWVINDKKTFNQKIMPLLEEYMPLTSRMRLQYKFLKKFLLNPDVEQYLIERELKYKNRESIIPLFTDTTLPYYFNEWLAGFIEAEGSFNHRFQGNYSFNIGKIYDLYLIESIRNYYGLPHLIFANRTGKVSGIPFYVFSVGSQVGTGRVIDHCANLLQGYKYYQLVKFLMSSKVFSFRAKDFFE